MALAKKMTSTKDRTGDGVKCEPDVRYYFFDKSESDVYSASWMEKQIDRERGHCWIAGSQIPIRWLRAKKEDAFKDGENYYKGEISAIRAKMVALKARQSPEPIEEQEYER